MTTAPDAHTEAATSEVSGAAGETALKNSELPGALPDISVEEPETVAETLDKPRKNSTHKAVKSPAGQAVSGNDTDEVLVSRLVADSKHRKSLSVHHLQRRLFELGYVEAGADVDGRYGELTALSVAAWQADHGLSGALDLEQATDLFKGDPNVTVVP